MPMKHCARLSRGARALGAVAATALALAFAPAAAAAGPFDAPQTETNAVHTPVITAPSKVKAGEAFDVTVTVGQQAHPSETGHFVRYIALYADGVELARTDLTPTLTVPRVTYRVRLQHSATLRAEEAPNHSAQWVAEHKVEVTAE